MSEWPKPSLSGIKLYFPCLVSTEDFLSLRGDSESLRFFIMDHPRLERRLEKLFLSEFITTNPSTGRPSFKSIPRAALLYRMMRPDFLVRAGLVNSHEQSPLGSGISSHEIVDLIFYVSEIEHRDHPLPPPGQIARSTPRVYVLQLFALPDYIALDYYRSLPPPYRVGFFRDLLSSEILRAYNAPSLVPQDSLLAYMASESAEMVNAFLQAAEDNGDFRSLYVDKLLTAAFNAHKAEDLASIAAPLVKNWCDAYPLPVWQDASEVLPSLHAGTFGRHNFLCAMFHQPAQNFDYAKGAALLRILAAQGTLPFRRAYAAFCSFPAPGFCDKLSRPEHDFCLDFLAQLPNDEPTRQARILALALMMDIELHAETQQVRLDRHCWLLLRAHNKLPQRTLQECLELLSAYYRQKLGPEDHDFIAFLANLVLPDQVAIKQILQEAAWAAAEKSARLNTFEESLQRQLQDWFYNYNHQFGL